MAERLRLAELLGGLSMVADLGYALEPGEAMRACVVGTSLARAVGLPEHEVTQTFYTALFRHVGCVGFAHELYSTLGDDLVANAAGGRTNFADLADVLSTLIPGATRGQPALARMRSAVMLTVRGSALTRRYETSSCEVASGIARRVGLSGGIQRSLGDVFEWWDGRGSPRGIRGDDIAPAARVARVAGDAVLFHRLGGPELALDALRRRSGTIADPTIVATLVTDPVGLLEEPAAGDPRERMLEIEPRPVVEIPESELRGVAEAFGDLGDLKVPTMRGHARAVANLTRAAADRVGLDEGACDEVSIAALLHDLGRAGVSNRVWEKPGPLTSVEWEQVRMYPYHSERILTSAPPLRRHARIVGLQRERLDGTGYHRGCGGRDIPVSARLLACADAFCAMTEPRAHRAALGAEAAAEELGREARSGLLDPDAVHAVLDAAGEDPAHAVPDTAPGGLSSREVEVLRLVARGCSNPEIARRLEISRRTAEHHVQHVYTKIGVSSRAAAALYALEHGLVPPSW